MSITYDQVKLEVKGISEELAASSSVVPSAFQSIKAGLYPAMIYFCFYIACMFTDVYIKTVWQGVGVISIFFLDIYYIFYKWIWSDIFHAS